jgi:hypothetical protein
MMIKVAFATVAAAALCAPAMAPATAASGPAVSNVAFSVPMKSCHSLLLNVCDNSVQVPVQACGTNVASGIGLGILGGKGSAKGGNNDSKCKQTTKSKHKH